MGRVFLSGGEYRVFGKLANDPEGRVTGKHALNPANPEGTWLCYITLDCTVERP